MSNRMIKPSEYECLWTILYMISAAYSFSNSLGKLTAISLSLYLHENTQNIYNHIVLQSFGQSQAHTSWTQPTE